MRHLHMPDHRGYSEADEFMRQSKSALQIILAIAIPVAIVIGGAYLAR